MPMPPAAPAACGTSRPIDIFLSSPVRPLPPFWAALTKPSTCKKPGAGVSERPPAHLTVRHASRRLHGRFLALPPASRGLAAEAETDLEVLLEPMQAV